MVTHSKTKMEEPLIQNLLIEVENDSTIIIRRDVLTRDIVINDRDIDIELD